MKPDIARKIRTHQVAISGSRFMPPSPVEVQPLLREFFRWYDRNKSSLHPVELAAAGPGGFRSVCNSAGPGSFTGI